MKSVVIIVINLSRIKEENETWDTIEYLKCRKNLNFDVDFRTHGTIVTKWDVILFG